MSTLDNISNISKKISFQIRPCDVFVAFLYLVSVFTLGYETQSEDNITYGDDKETNNLISSFPLLLCQGQIIQCIFSVVELQTPI